MNRNIGGLIVFSLASALAAQETGTVTVTGDRVSLRAGPAVTDVLLDRAMSGDELALKDNSRAEWVGVVPPETVDLWVHAAYIDDGVVAAEKLNVRSGPSLNHTIVGVLSQGQPVAVRGETAEWLRIAPTDDATVWISRSYVELSLPEPETPEPEIPEPSASVEAPDDSAADLAEIPPVQVEEVTAKRVPFNEVYRPDPEKEQGVTDRFAGVLTPENEWLYRLAAVDFPEITICYVRGNPEQMEAFSGRLLRLSGRTYWTLQRDLPLIVPERIDLVR